jgi:dihydroorotate dehydrogenase electron transfer subunit
VTILLGARYPGALYPSTLLPQATKVISIVENNDVKSLFRHGNVVEMIPEYISEADQVFACGPVAMYIAMKDTMQKWPAEKPVQISLEVRMGCGFGVCYGCSIRTRQGMKRICKEGPVFNINDIIWQEVKI